MSELRAPDPTLSDLAEQAPDPGCVDDRVVRVDMSPVVPVAHSCYRNIAHGSDLSVNAPALHSRWFAVPCRECFPDAPPPGCIKYASYPWHSEVVPNLAWQVAR